MIDPQSVTGCSDAIFKFLRALDHREYDNVCALFATDGAWDRAGQRVEGHANIREVLDKRPAELSTVHMASNLLFEQDGDEVVVRYLLSSYIRIKEEPFHLHGVLWAQDRLRNTDAGWRFVYRQAKSAFP